MSQRTLFVILSAVLLAAADYDFRVIDETASLFFFIMHTRPKSLRKPKTPSMPLAWITKPKKPMKLPAAKPLLLMLPPVPPMTPAMLAWRPEPMKLPAALLTKPPLLLAVLRTKLLPLLPAKSLLPPLSAVLSPLLTPSKLLPKPFP